MFEARCDAYRAIFKKLYPNVTMVVKLKISDFLWELAFVEFYAFPETLFRRIDDFLFELE
jgi:hypothetical protein